MATERELRARLKEWKDQKKDCVNLRDELKEIEQGVVGQFKFQFNNAENGFGEAYRSDEATEMKKMIDEDRKIYEKINKAIGTVKGNLINRINDLKKVINDAEDMLSQPDRYTHTTKNYIGWDTEANKPIYEDIYTVDYVIPTLRSPTFNEISLPDVTGKNSKKKVTGGNSSPTDDDKESEADTGGSETSKKNTGKKGNKGTGTGGSKTTKAGKETEKNKILEQKLKDIGIGITSGAKKDDLLDAVGKLFSDSNNNVNSVVSTVVGLLYDNKKTRGNIPTVVEQLYENRKKLAENVAGYVAKVLSDNGIIEKGNKEKLIEAINGFLEGGTAGSFAGILTPFFNSTPSNTGTGGNSKPVNSTTKTKKDPVAGLKKGKKTKGVSENLSNKLKEASETHVNIGTPPIKGTDGSGDITWDDGNITWDDDWVVGGSDWTVGGGSETTNTGTGKGSKPGNGKGSESGNGSGTLPKLNLKKLGAIFNKGDKNSVLGAVDEYFGKNNKGKMVKEFINILYEKGWDNEKIKDAIWELYSKRDNLKDMALKAAEIWCGENKWMYSAVKGAINKWFETHKPTAKNIKQLFEDLKNGDLSSFLS